MSATPHGMQEARTFSVALERPWTEVYEAIWRPEAFPRWASGLAKSSLRQEGERWLAEGPEGAVRIRFTGRNAFGVMDHFVDGGAAQEIYVPLRVIANGEGAEVMLTLFRQPDMTDAKFQADIEWVQRDLAALRSLLSDRKQA